MRSRLVLSVVFSGVVLAVSLSSVPSASAAAKGDSYARLWFHMPADMWSQTSCAFYDKGHYMMIKMQMFEGKVGQSPSQFKPWKSKPDAHNFGWSAQWHRNYWSYAPASAYYPQAFFLRTECLYRDKTTQSWKHLGGYTTAILNSKK